jgi:hypothetical protein
MDLMIEKQSLSEGDDPEWYSVDDPLWVNSAQAQAVRGAIEAYLLPVNVLTDQPSPMSRLRMGVDGFGSSHLGVIASELFAKTNFEIVEFSCFVRDRARALLGATGYRIPLGKPEDVLRAIEKAGDWFEDAVYALDAWPAKESRAADSLGKERAQQNLLAAESITDDQSAVDYIERVRPRIEALANQWELSGLRDTEQRNDRSHKARIEVGYRESKIRGWEATSWRQTLIKS